MPFFKHVSSEHIDKVLLGSLRFSSLDYFRHLETDYNDCHTGDRLEGAFETVLDSPMEIDGQPTELQREVAGRASIGLESTFSGRLKIENVRITQHCGHWHIFSISEVDHYKDRDGCIAIADIDQLRDAVISGSMDGVPMSEYFDFCVAGPVEYLPRQDSAWDVESKLAASPLAKRPSYAHQKEWRVALRARDELLRDIVYIDIHSSADLFKEVRRASVPVSLSSHEQSIEEVATEIGRLIDGIARFDRETNARCFGHSIWSRIDDEALAKIERNRAKAHDALVKAERKAQFAREFPLSEIKELYWRARLLGVRGSWDSSLSSSRDPLPAHLAIDLGRLAHRLSPDRFPDR